MRHDQLKFNKKNSQGFGFIGLFITIAIIAFMVFGYQNFKGQSQKNQIQQGQDAIKAAQDAANKERQDNQTLQDQVQGLQPDLSPSTYRDIQNKAKNLQQ